MERLYAALGGRKATFALVATALGFLNFALDLGISAGEMTVVVAPLLGFAGLEGVADIRSRPEVEARVSAGMLGTIAGAAGLEANGDLDVDDDDSEDG